MYKIRKQVMVIFIILFAFAGYLSVDYTEANKKVIPEVNEEVQTVVIEEPIETEAVPKAEVEDQSLAIKDSRMTYRYPLQINLVYEPKDNRRHVATTDLFHITSYGEPTMFITYVVDMLHREYENYMTHFDLVHIPTIRLFFYDDLEQFTARGTTEGYSAFQSNQEIHIRMPSTYEVDYFTKKMIEEEVVYASSIHEFMHIMQYNKNNFALSTYEEPWLLEAMAEYGSMLLNPHSDEMIKHVIQVTNM